MRIGLLTGGRVAGVPGRKAAAAVVLGAIDLAVAARNHLR